MSIFPSLAELQEITGPIVADANVQLGSTVDIFSVVKDRQPGGTYKEIPRLSAHDVPMRLKMLTSEQAQSIFGIETIVEMRGSLARSAGSIDEGNAVEVIGGEFTGQWLKAARLIVKPNSDSYLIGFVKSEALR